jgi:serine protease Do
LKKNQHIFLILALLLSSVISYPKIGRSDNQAVSPFTEAIEKATPAIVTILVKKQSAQQKSGSSGRQDFFENDLIKDFFGTTPDRPKTEHLESTPSWGSGSGFIISTDGYIVTNHHVIKDSVKITVFLQNKRKYEAKLVGSDAQSDIALLKIEDTHLPTINLGNSDLVRVGEWAIAVGSPVEFIQTVTVGIISAKGRSSIGISEYEDFIQTDAAINPGNSGGPLLNIRGEAIGINTAFITQKGGYSGIGFAIPSTMAAAIIKQLKKHGHMERGWLGVSLKDSQPEEVLSLQSPNYRNAVQIIDIRTNSPAELAGLKKNDLIVAINKKGISGAADLRNTIALTEPGTRITIQFYRNDSLHEASVNIKKNPLL